MDVERVAKPVAASSEEADWIRITRRGKLCVWVKKALDFFQSHPDRPLVLYSAPTDVSASTIARLISVVEIIKREYLRGSDVSAGDATGLHQYNQLLFEQQNTSPAGDALHFVLDGHSHVKQSFAPHMKITLSTVAIARNSEQRATYQTPAVRRVSRAAKARMRKKARKQGEIADGD